ncbi:MAG TPA: GAF domain-containing protein [Bacteroidales bacterium]|jgi:GAF domain-containing protein|nr:histidine kinase [Bacteroidota bacterium]HJN06271.1 GAF domain-containing protein [Bacteroidales bacterium]|tara:strand:- start:2956 stop:3417 length:462 start_codon:yes stop_codon:yes gene_type:complete
MDADKKQKKYQRLYSQIKDLIDKSSNNPISNMSTIAAILHHKIEYFFWTGFYLLQDGKLQAGPYQGSLACINLASDKGVCWAAINKKKTFVVPNVHDFPNHIACDSRSLSEIVVPVRDENNEIIGVMDVDSSSTNSFDEVDAQWLEKIVVLIY